MIYLFHWWFEIQALLCFFRAPRPLRSSALCTIVLHFVLTKSHWQHLTAHLFGLVSDTVQISSVQLISFSHLPPYMLDRCCNIWQEINVKMQKAIAKLMGIDPSLSCSDLAILVALLIFSVVEVSPSEDPTRSVQSCVGSTCGCKASLSAREGWIPGIFITFHYPRNSNSCMLRMHKSSLLRIDLLWICYGFAICINC